MRSDVVNMDVFLSVKVEETGRKPPLIREAACDVSMWGA
jgi:hypothetical protein